MARRIRRNSPERFHGERCAAATQHPSSGSSQKADRFWSAPAERERRPVMARRIRRNSPERFHGSDVLLQPSTLQADNHKKRTGFGPQQASFGVYVSNAFGGMSGALKLRLHSRSCEGW